MMFGYRERDLYERMLMAEKIALQKERDRGDRLEERVHQLTATILELRREGYELAHPPIDVDPAEQLDDLIIAAVRERAFPETPEWNHLIRVAEEELARGTAPEKIAEIILEGDDPSLYQD